VATLAGPSVPLMVNMVEGGKTPMLSAAELEKLGFSLVIFPGGILRALAKAAGEYYASLAEHGGTQSFRSRMFDFDALNDLVGTPDMIARGKRNASAHDPGGKTKDEK
jgi:2-methylisocitrate lyase-like PEP mutase family enzyme